MTQPPNPIADTKGMIAGMSPERQPGRFVFCSVPEAQRTLATERALASFREPEGLSVLLPVAEAEALGLAVAHPMAQITLKVYSALDGIGLTAAVATRLTEHKIPCNVIAATLHDHVFVPETMADAAVQALEALQQEAAGPD